MTYQQAYNKIIEAYFKDEIKPLNAQFCFCGTLQGDCDWRREEGSKNYTTSEYGKMERALFFKFPVICEGPGALVHSDFNKELSEIKKLSDYEDRLFAGMSAALDVLKEIHRSLGENVDDVPVFAKRVLI